MALPDRRGRRQPWWWDLQCRRRGRARLLGLLKVAAQPPPEGVRAEPTEEMGVETLLGEGHRRVHGAAARAGGPNGSPAGRAELSGIRLIRASPHTTKRMRETLRHQARSCGRGHTLGGCNLRCTQVLPDVRRPALGAPAPSARRRCGPGSRSSSCSRQMIWTAPSRSARYAAASQGEHRSPGAVADTPAVRRPGGSATRGLRCRGRAHASTETIASSSPRCTASAGERTSSASSRSISRGYPPQRLPPRQVPDLLLGPGHPACGWRDGAL